MTRFLENLGFYAALSKTFLKARWSLIYVKVNIF